MSIRSGGYREITRSSVILGIVTGSLMSMSFVYMTLKLGFSAVGSEVAAIIGFLILRWVMKSGSILENNINQTISSAISASSYGVIFTLPSLLLLGKDFNPFTMCIAAFAGSILGLTLIIPLRKQMIEFERLRFPSGIAVAAILKTPGTGKSRSLYLIIGFITSIIVVLLCRFSILPSNIPIGSWFGLPEYLDTSISLSLMNIGAGLLSGAAGLPLVIGGVLAYWIIAPLAVSMNWVPEVNRLDYISNDLLSPIGIGMIVGGALMGVLLVFPVIKNAFKSIFTSARMGILKEHADEMSAKSLRILFFLSFVLLLIIVLISGTTTFGMAVIITLVAAIWLALSGLIVTQCAGTTGISPISGLSLIAVAIIYKLTAGDVVTSIVITVAVCVAVSQSSRMMQDMKAGFLTGAIPFKQQIVHYSTSIIGPVISIFVMYLLWQTSDGLPGFGPLSSACITKHADCIPAPQAVAMKSMIESLVDGSIPLVKYVLGSILGAMISLVPVGSAGILVGLALYLPFHITLGYSLGCLTTIIATKFKGQKFFGDTIIPAAAGLILGEALTEIVYALFKVITN